MAGESESVSPRIAPNAWRLWESFDVPVPLPEVVAALMALPPGEREEVRVLRPPAVLHRIKGTVFGTRFVLVCVKGDGDRRTEVLSVIPL